MKKLLIVLGITLLLTTLACVTKEVAIDKLYGQAYTRQVFII